MKYFKLILILFFYSLNSQNISVNNDLFYWNARVSKLKNEKNFSHSLNIKPIDISKNYNSKNDLVDIFKKK